MGNGDGGLESRDADSLLEGAGLPAPETRGRLLVIRTTALLAIAATLAYLAWRIGFTVRASLWLAIPLWLLELHALIGLVLFTFSLWDLDSVTVPEPRIATDLRVAVLIPTYNEPREVLLPTIAAAVSLEPAHETWVLDDGQRPWVKDLAGTLGALYLTREDRSHAKAGNLNNALGHLDVDVVGVLDADHVPSSGFLTDTLGYFDDSRVAVVQTPQDFYNLDSFEHGKNRALGWRRQGTLSFSEQRLFYRAIQPGKNRWHAAFWCGTSALVRVAALREVGGVAYETLTEDIHTTIRMHRRNWRTIYHNEVLAHGLAARNASEYFSQRLRWGTGAMQVLHVEHPITGPGLSLSQRLAYASTLLGWFDSWRTLGYLLVPPAVLFSGAVPIQASAVVFGIFFAATYLVQRVALSLLGRGYAPQGMAMLFEVVRMPTVLEATWAYVQRRSHAFRVTEKAGSSEHRRVAPPRLILALLALSLLAAVWFGCTLAGLTPIHYSVRSTAYGALGWLCFNAVLLTAAILRVRADRFAVDRRTAVRLKIGAPVLLDDKPGALLDLSMGGAFVRVLERADADGTHTLLLPFGGVDGIELRCDERGHQEVGGGGVLVRLQFTEGQEQELGSLATALFGSRSSVPEEVPV
jgi:cellulose synthase/poly-beta-1,6-N-acetylglucosamine synthase-like glycosyltransferase